MLQWTGLVLALSLALVNANVVPTIEADFIENVNGDLVAETSSQRIVSGWLADEGQHPHQVSLRLVQVDGGVGGCGGSIISRQWILTAAHCTTGRASVIVRAGVTNLTTPLFMTESSTWFYHPNYDETRPSVVQPDEVSLIQLYQPLRYSELLKPIKLQPRADALRDYTGATMLASGYGTTWTSGTSPEHLNWVYLTGVNHAACLIFGTAVVNQNTICARWFNVTSQSTCQGDSGGPLVLEENGVSTLIGVTSFVAGGTIGCHSGYPAGFVRPGSFHDWYTLITGIDFENLVEDEEDEVDVPVTRPPVTPPPEMEPPTTNPPETEPPTTTSPEVDQPTTPRPDHIPDLTEIEQDILNRLEIDVSVKIKLNDKVIN